MSDLQRAYDAGIENIKFHIESLDAMQNQAGVTLTLLLTGLIGTIGYVAHLVENSASSTAITALVFLAAYLMFLSVVLVEKCLKAGDLWPPTNEPANFVDYKWEEILKDECSKLQERIVANKQRNLNMGRWLNIVCYGALLTPVVFGVGMIVATVMTKASPA